MKFGVRECANITFRVKNRTKINSKIFQPGQTILSIDSATISELQEQSSSTYAQGGRGNARLIAWEGDKVLTFTVTDALISTFAFDALLGCFNPSRYSQRYFHNVSYGILQVFKQEDEIFGYIDLREALSKFGDIIGLQDIQVIVDDNFPFYIIKLNEDGDITSQIINYQYVAYEEGIISFLNLDLEEQQLNKSIAVFIDYYILRKNSKISVIQITPYNFAGNYYVEADTLFRNVVTGIDMPAILTLPNVKLQSNFTITLSGTGEPNAFNFVFDAFPGYTYFNRNKKVLCAIQIIEDKEIEKRQGLKTLMEKNSIHEDESIFNSTVSIDKLIQLKNFIDIDFKPQIKEDYLLLKQKQVYLPSGNHLQYRPATLRDLVLLKNYFDNNFLIFENDTCYITKGTNSDQFFPEQSDISEDPVNRVLKQSDIKKMQAYINASNPILDNDTLILKGRINI